MSGHDTQDPRREQPKRQCVDYARDIPFDAPIERVFDALTSRDGLARWWTPLVSGNPTAGGWLRFGFAGLDEEIVMRVEQATHPSTVIWSCLTHTGHSEWEGTRIFISSRAS